MTIKFFQIVRPDSVTFTGNAGEAALAAEDMEKKVYSIKLAVPDEENVGGHVEAVHWLRVCSQCGRLEGIALDEVKLLSQLYFYEMRYGWVTLPVGHPPDPSISNLHALNFAAEVAARISHGGAETFLLVP